MNLSIRLGLSSLLISGTSLAFHVLIDPGHGGADRGAIYQGQTESDLTLRIASLVKKELSRSDGIRVSLTRYEDRALSLEARAQATTSLAVDLLVSIHANASLDPGTRGMEIYFPALLPFNEDRIQTRGPTHDEGPIPKRDNRQTPPSDLSSDLSSITADLRRQGRTRLSLKFSEEFLGLWKGQLKPGPFYVLKNSSSAAVLIEIGFLSHPEELAKLKNRAEQGLMARKIAKAIDLYQEFANKNQIFLCPQKHLE